MSVQDTFKGIVFKTYLENMYNKEFARLRHAAENPRKASEEGLRSILSYAKDTSYGIEHKFSYILEAKDDEELYRRYETEVKVNDYNDLENTSI